MDGWMMSFRSYERRDSISIHYMLNLPELCLHANNSTSTCINSYNIVREERDARIFILSILMHGGCL